MSHGTWATYNAGCRCDNCRQAACRYQKQRALLAARGIPRRVPSIGLRRRIQALACLGWDMYAIARELGTGRETVRQWTLNDTVYRRTHEQMAAVYDRLSMRLPPAETPQQKCSVARTRNRARRNGWAPPLAWPEGTIDDPNAKPATGGSNHKRRTDVDPVVVQRILAGEPLPATVAERNAVVTAWAAAGRSLNELERMTGWRAERYRGGAA